VSWQFFLLVFGPPLLGLTGALIWWAFRLRHHLALRRGFAVAAVLGALIGVVGDLVLRVIGVPSLLPFELPAGFWEAYRDFRFLAPPLAGLLAVLVLAFPIVSRKASATAALTPRSPVTFIQGRWLVTPGILLAILVAIAVACGVVSEPDEMTGRYTMWMIEIGGEFAMGTTIYGWFYSLPALAVLLVMIIVGWIDLALISRPALNQDNGEDQQRRVVRSRNVVTAITATLFLAVSQAFGSLAGTASLRASSGSFNSWTPIAALEPALHVTSYVAAALGVAYWVSIALTALPSPTRTRAAATA
tara:strand:+ start:4270 stop:5178 length:909 start_codon:yes stop_codon:yes gene_type:complete